VREQTSHRVDARLPVVAGGGLLRRGEVFLFRGTDEHATEVSFSHIAHLLLILRFLPTWSDELASTCGTVQGCEHSGSSR
jgi:hypothetical protein